MQELIQPYFCLILWVMTGTCRPKNSPGVCAQASRTSSSNVHAKIQIYDLWLSVHFCTSTRNWCSKHQWSYFTCLFQRAEIQVNKYKCRKLSTKAEFFPWGIYWDSFTNWNTGNYFRHGINITTNQRLSPTFRGNRNTIIIGDSQMSLLPISFWGRGDVCTQAKLQQEQQRRRPVHSSSGRHKAREWISIGNSLICSDIWHKYHEWYFKIVIRNFTSR